MPSIVCLKHAGGLIEIRVSKRIVYTSLCLVSLRRKRTDMERDMILQLKKSGHLYGCLQSVLYGINV